MSFDAISQGHSIPHSFEIVAQNDGRVVSRRRRDIEFLHARRTGRYPLFILGDFEEDAVGIVEVAEHLVAGVVRYDGFGNYDGIAEELYSGVL